MSGNIRLIIKEITDIVRDSGRDREKKTYLIQFFLALYCCHVVRCQTINLKTESKRTKFSTSNVPQLKNMQISRIIEFMQREQCENENEDIKFSFYEHHHTQKLGDRYTPMEYRKQYYPANHFDIRMQKR